MKIIMLGHKRVPSRAGGVEIAVGEISHRMAAMGHRVTCYNRTGRRGEYKGVALKTVPALHKKGLEAVTSSFFAAVCSAFAKADVVHIHAEGPAFWCWIPKMFGKRVVVTVHGLDWQREKWKGGFGAAYIRAGERMAVRFADEIIVLSRNMQSYFQKTYGRSTTYIPNGVTRPGVVPEHGGDYILYLGRLVPEKGIHYLIEAFRDVKTEKKLVIAGAASDTEDYAARLRATAAGDPRVSFAGFVEGETLEELYNEAYLYVLPSDVEGMPLSLLEAMSYGNCCVVSDIPECAEVVQTKAVTFPKGNVAALRDCLQRLCDSPEAAAACRAGAADHVCGKYDWDDVTARTLEVYRGGNHENSDGE